MRTLKISFSGGCELHLTALRLEEAKKHARSRRNGFYEVLGVPQSSRMVDIKQAYLRIAKKHHPDRAGHDNTESREIFDVSEPERSERNILLPLEIVILSEL